MLDYDDEDETDDGSECGACHGSGGGDYPMHCSACNGRGGFPARRREREAYHHECDAADYYVACDDEVRW